MEKIELNFINRSNDTNNSSVVIFQKNIADPYEKDFIAWKVIENCGILDNHPFLYPIDFMVSASDSYGNYAPQLPAYEGQAFEMVNSTSGDILQLTTTFPVNDEVEIWNNLLIGAIDAICYRDGKLIAAKRNLAPGQKAVFEFKPILYIGAVSQIEQGDIMSTAIISGINSEINLTGIRSADIVMTGGGPGKDASPFMFNLENINKF